MICLLVSYAKKQLYLNNEILYPLHGSNFTQPAETLANLPHLTHHWF
jgi:hypothetical protein